MNTRIKEVIEDLNRLIYLLKVTESQNDAVDVPKVVSSLGFSIQFLLRAQVEEMWPPCSLCVGADHIAGDAFAA